MLGSLFPRSMSSYDVFQSETTSQEQSEHPQAWMCRPCDWYWDEGRECRRLRARVHQYFLFGELLDCSAWTQDYESCLAFRRTRDPSHLTAVVASEEKRFQQRMLAAANNDVWQYRSSPPANWSAPLPDYMEQRTKGSLLEFVSKRQQQASASSSRSQNHKAAD